MLIDLWKQHIYYRFIYRNLPQFTKDKEVKNILEYKHYINTVEDFKDFIIAVYTIIDNSYKEIIPKYIQNRRNKSK